MFLARWQVDARFGHRQEVIDLVRSWTRDIGPKIGWEEKRSRLLGGSIGTREATVEVEWTVDDLAALDRGWAELGKIDAHKEWSLKLEPLIVSGSSVWSILRVL